MKIDLRKNTILVTGATGGIGQAIVKVLAEYGATIAIHYHRNRKKASNLARITGNNSQIFSADLSSASASFALFRNVLRNYGRVHTVINNAGIYEASPIEKDPKSWFRDWKRTMAINLTAPAVLCREAVRHFLKSGGGRIINIASRAAFRGEDKNHWAYGAAKGGMVTLSRTIAREYGKNNIKCFVVAPGFVKTRMIDNYIKRFGTRELIDKLALSQLTTPEDVAPAVLFLASGLMDHATGCTIDINAGSYIR